MNTIWKTERDARRSRDSERDARRTRCDSEADTTNLESRATRDARRDVSDLTLARRATATRYEPPDDLKMVVGEDDAAGPR